MLCCVRRPLCGAAHKALRHFSARMEKDVKLRPAEAKFVVLDHFVIEGAIFLFAENQMAMANFCRDDQFYLANLIFVLENNQQKLSIICHLV